jgi:DNA-binding LytR/AlgR family response regulator
MKLNCLVVDDEQLARELLGDYISKVPFLDLKGSVKNPVEVAGILESVSIDIIFLDIQMPDITGIELLKTLNQKPVVVFTTAYSEYAIEGYELDVLDYLVKPFSFERFLKAVNKAAEMVRLKRNTESPPVDPEYISINADHKIYRVRIDEILYIEGLREYVSYYTPAKRIITLASLKNLEESLPAKKFLRVHKSYIVPIDKVKALEGNMLDIGVKKIPIGRSYREEVFKIFAD